MNLNWKNKLINLILFASVILLAVWMAMQIYVSTSLYSGRIKQQEAMEITFMSVWVLVAGFGVVAIAAVGSWVKFKLMLEREQNKELEGNSVEMAVDHPDGTETQYLFKFSGESREVQLSKFMMELIERSEGFRGLYDWHQSRFQSNAMDAADIFRPIEIMYKPVKKDGDSEEESKPQPTVDEIAAISEAKKQIESASNSQMEMLTVDGIPNAREVAEKLVKMCGFEKLYNFAMENGLHLTYQPISDVLCLDNPRWPLDGDARFRECTAAYFLTSKAFPVTFRTQLRESPTRRIFKMRKAYNRMRYVCNLLEDNLPLLVERELLGDKAINDHAIAVAKMLAYADFTFFTSRLQTNFISKYQLTEAENRRLKKEQDKAIGKKLMDLLTGGQLDQEITRPLRFKPVNITSIVLSIITLVVGFMIRAMIVP